MCIRCLNKTPVVMARQFDNMEPAIIRIAKRIYAGKMKIGDIDAKMVTRIAEQLLLGVFHGFGKSFDDALTGTEHTLMQQVEKNVYLFSGFKNAKQLKETTLLLKADDGSLKPFKQFLNDVRAINTTYNEVYLSAEYNTANACAQTAAQWLNYTDSNVEALTFRTAGDDRVRPDHEALDGLTVSIDDPLLDEYWTPLDWNCRCDWVPAQAKDVQDYNKGDIPDIPDLFRNNTAKTGMVFTKEHPYFADTTKPEAARITAQVDKLIPDREVKGES